MTRDPTHISLESTRPVLDQKGEIAGYSTHASALNGRGTLRHDAGFAALDPQASHDHAIAASRRDALRRILSSPHIPNPYLP